MIIQCATCEHDGGHGYKDSVCSACDQWSKWGESPLAKEIRAEERARIIELVEKKQKEAQADVDRFEHIQVRDEMTDGYMRGRIDACELLIAELRDEK